MNTANSFVETNFDEKSGIVPCTTNWGQWWQSVKEVHLEVKVLAGTKGKSISVDIKPSRIDVSVNNSTIIKGQLYATVIADETVWTLEDRTLLHIVLTKADAITKDTIWEGLLTDGFKADPMTLLEMRKKLDLEKFQMENPGYDFSSAQLSKCYDALDNTK